MCVLETIIGLNNEIFSPGMAEMQRVWIVLLSDLLLVCVYDPDEQIYLIIEEVIQLNNCTLTYEAISPDGTPDLTWIVNVADQAEFGPRRYKFEADTAELSAMWKCCLSRQIDLSKQGQTKVDHFSSVSGGDCTSGYSGRQKNRKIIFCCSMGLRP